MKRSTKGAGPYVPTGDEIPAFMSRYWRTIRQGGKHLDAVYSALTEEERRVFTWMVNDDYVVVEVITDGYPQAPLPFNWQ